MTQRQQFGLEVADDLRRTLAREERRRKRLARTLMGVGVFALLVAGLTVAGLAMRGSRPSAVTASARPVVTAPAQVAQSQGAQVGVAAEASTPAAKPAPVPDVAAPKKKTAAKKVVPPKVAPSRIVSASPARTAVAQRFKITIGRVGYEPASISAKAGSPVTLTVGKGEGCAAGFNMPELGVRADNSSGPVTVKLGKLKAGSYTYTCSMGMVSGTLRVH
jgi:plastocyanin